MWKGHMTLTFIYWGRASKCWVHGYMCGSAEDGGACFCPLELVYVGEGYITRCY